MQPVVEVADVLCKVNVAALGLNTWQQRTLYALQKCRTAALGRTRIDACDSLWQHPH
jgi:hypothetical protein